MMTDGILWKRWRTTVLVSMVLALVLPHASSAASEKPGAPKAAAPVCEPDGVVNAVVSLKPPSGTSIVGLKLEIGYPRGVAVPGLADEPTVKQRVQVLPGGLFMSPNDKDGTMVIALVGTEALAPGPLLSVQFDRCKGQPAPRAGDFHCRVEQGSNKEGALLTDGITCALAPINQKEKGR